MPSGLFEVLDIPGVGPKAARLMWQDLGIESVDDLKAQLDSPALQALPRMGKKTVDNIRRAIAFGEQTRSRIPLGQARPIAVELKAALERTAGVKRLAFAGSLRRGRETIGDLDFLAVADDPEALRERFTTLPIVSQVLARGDTKLSVRLEIRNLALQADLRIVPEEAWGAALLYFTGSKDHNVRLREIAIKKGMRLNEYGLFAGTDERPQDRGEKPLAAASEEAIYDALGLPFVAAGAARDRGELDQRAAAADRARRRPRRAPRPHHRQRRQARDRGARPRRPRPAASTPWRSPTTPRARRSPAGSSPSGCCATPRRCAAPTARSAASSSCAGSEVDILADGRLDYDDEILAGLDIVVASPHAALRQDPEAATRRLLRAIRHPLVHVIGHPTGRIVQRREGLAPDMEALFRAAAEHDVALEVNANPRRLDLRVDPPRGRPRARLQDRDQHRRPPRRAAGLPDLRHPDGAPGGHGGGVVHQHLAGAEAPRLAAVEAIEGWLRAVQRPGSSGLGPAAWVQRPGSSGPAPRGPPG